MKNLRYRHNEEDKQIEVKFSPVSHSKMAAVFTCEVVYFGAREVLGAQSSASLSALVEDLMHHPHAHAHTTTPTATTTTPMGISARPHHPHLSYAAKVSNTSTSVKVISRNSAIIRSVKFNQVSLDHSAICEGIITLTLSLSWWSEREVNDYSKRCQETDSPN